MLPECAYSFADLYKAAFGQEPGQQELLDLYAKSQAERNEIVGQWATRAGWQTKTRTGSDGQEYSAFAPTFNEL